MTEEFMSFRVKALLWALAIGFATVAGSTLATTLPFGDPIAQGDDSGGLIIMMLLVALPFLALALLAERSRILWGVGLAVTLLLWGWYVVMAITYRAHGSHVLAHMGFDVILSFYPLLLAPILAILSLLRKYWAKSES